MPMSSRIVALCLCFVPCSVAMAADPLAVAKKLTTTRFEGWQYGPNPVKKQVDCVQFLMAVAEESIGSALSPKVRNRILIVELSKEEKKPAALGKLVLDGDERTKGVQSALVEASLGTAVGVADALPGDLIQYWMKKSDGTWFGHAGVIESVDRTGATPKARIFGAHASPAPGKIGTSTFELRLVDGTDDRRIYLVRIK